ncbi:DUF6510 family protein [Streptomyces sp. B6B3]|uniref:DUF6510 family protein n=1 Tax=Streptomyces sp. B6B3 TaxID=3153570 RepID=UPI00325C7A62
MPHEPDHTDGNSLAGPLAEILSVDATTGWWRCPECGRSGPVAQLHVYGPEPGLTARCPGCAHIALRLVRAGDHVWLSMGGPADTFRFPVASRPPDATP